MLIAGAGGHAKELIGILYDLNQKQNIYCFDDVSLNPPEKILDIALLVRDEAAVRQIFKVSNAFALGVGRPQARAILMKKMEGWGGTLTSIVSPHARIGRLNVMLGEGLNIMAGAVITENISIGTGSLINANVTVHHDCEIGNFCELSPGCHLLGSVKVGEMAFIGAGAVILPHVKIGAHAVIGAGSVVTKNVAEGVTVKGVPAKFKPLKLENIGKF
jgi:sugar O-acyltransferase (sialic acid O-acetyltransferase NeuD family)